MRDRENCLHLDQPKAIWRQELFEESKMSKSPLDREFSQLPLAERMLWAHAVVDSAIAEAQAAPVTPEQLEEIRRCDAAVDSGEMKCSPWDEVRKRLFSEK